MSTPTPEPSCYPVPLPTDGTNHGGMVCGPWPENLPIPEDLQTPQTVVGVAPTLPVTGPAPYAPTIGALGLLIVALGALTLRFARRQDAAS